MIKKTGSYTFKILAISIVCTLSCANGLYKPNTDRTDSLSDRYKDLFHLGAAINEDVILGKDLQSKNIVTSEFNSITPENSLKWMFLQPFPNKFNFGAADKYVELGIKNNMHIVGHALVWHNQLADFMKTTGSRSEFKKHVENHINTVVSRYKGKIDAWDVVNEAFNENGSLRPSVFKKQMGDNYIEDVFKLAETADPDANLIYNDYNLYKPAKRAGVLKMVKKLQENGTKINAIGVQAHWRLNSPSLKEIEQIILDISDLGVEVMFTELDVTVLPNPWELVGAEVTQNFSKFEGDPKMDPYPKALPKSVEKQLAKRYEDIFKLFIKHQDKISRVTFWGVMDKHSWLNDWPIKGRTNYPLLFDRNYQPKKAYNKLINLIGN
ncbi:endo-1,4-beta-xylanase [Flavobacteriaceae bacterium]|nr:endo-1,4-beta-xylanase [Flavobacteriaceae bacterium]MDA9029542.1 endo-1,4-beta-xylanase [Flavobacteriaceae bacterium]